MIYSEINDFITSGSLQGHLKSVQHPRMFSYIYGFRNKVSMFDLNENLFFVKEAMLFLMNSSIKRSSVFIGGLPAGLADALQFSNIEISFINCRWKGGSLTNYKHFKKFFKESENNIIKFPQISVLLYVESYLIMSLEENNILRIPCLTITDSDMDVLQMVFPLFGNNDKISTLLFFLALSLHSKLMGHMLERYKFLIKTLNIVNKKYFEISHKSINFYFSINEIQQRDLKNKRISKRKRLFSIFFMNNFLKVKKWKKFIKIIEKRVTHKRFAIGIGSKNKRLFLLKRLSIKNPFKFGSLRRFYVSKIKRKPTYFLKKRRFKSIPLRIKSTIFPWIKDKIRLFNRKKLLRCGVPFSLRILRIAIIVYKQYFQRHSMPIKQWSGLHAYKRLRPLFFRKRNTYHRNLLERKLSKKRDMKILYNNIFISKFISNKKVIPFNILLKHESCKVLVDTQLRKISKKIAPKRFVYFGSKYFPSKKKLRKYFLYNKSKYYQYKKYDQVIKYNNKSLKRHNKRNLKSVNKKKFKGSSNKNNYSLPDLNRHRLKSTRF
jgi:ribosomal protein S2